MFIVQHIKTDVAIRLEIDLLLSTEDLREAEDKMASKVEEIKEEIFDGETEEEIEESGYVDDTIHYWEYCDEDGRNEVVCITKIK